MNAKLEELWLKLFDKKITSTEASQLEGLVRMVGNDSPLTILAALQVRMLHLVLIENKDSPFRTLAAFRKTMEEHRRSVGQITNTYSVLDFNLSEWNGMLARTEKDLVQLRKFARAATIGQLLSRDKELGGSATGLARRLLYLAWGGCFICGGAGALLAAFLVQ